jgi:hypothetical protein
VYTTLPGTDGVPGQTIESAKYNANVHDVEKALNDPTPIRSGGTGGSTIEEALDNLHAEMAYQTVTDYNTFVFHPGSFKSATSAINSPVAGHAFSGIIHTLDNPPSPPGTLPNNINITLEARDQTDVAAGGIGKPYTRQKINGVWGSWIVGGIGGGTTPPVVDPTTDLWVNTTGDTMTGNLTFNKPVDTLSNQIIGSTNNSLRWLMQIGNNTPEVTGNGGSDFTLARFSNTGAQLPGWLRVRRDTGWLELTDQINAALVLDVDPVAAMAAGPHTVPPPPVATPLEVASTWNPSDMGPFVVLSGGNLVASGEPPGTPDSTGVRSNTSRTSGKRYFEVRVEDGSGDSAVGIGTVGADYEHSYETHLSQVAGVDLQSGLIYVNSGVGTLIEPDGILVFPSTVCVAVDFGASRMWIRVVGGTNVGNWNGSAAQNPSTGAGGINISSLFPTQAAYAIALFPAQTSQRRTINFGATAFAQTIPTGFVPWQDAPITPPDPPNPPSPTAGNGWRSVFGMTNKKRRWQIDLGSADPETGSNNGSSFIVSRWDDAGGTLLSSPLIIGRNDGAVRMAHNLIVLGTGLKPGGGPWTDTSDARVKTVVRDYPQGLAQIKQITPRTFTYKANEVMPNALPPNPNDPPVQPGDPDPRSPHYGVLGEEFTGLIAQEIEAAFPEMVTQTPASIDGAPVSDLRVLDTTALIYAVINSLKELATRVEALEAKP